MNWNVKLDLRGIKLLIGGVVLAALLALGWWWVRPTSPWAAYATASKYVKKQFPSATVFRKLTWKDDFYRIQEDGTIECFFWVRPPGERNFRPLMVPVKRWGPVYRVVDDRVTR